jgi:hypothetical protein
MMPMTYDGDIHGELTRLRRGEEELNRLLDAMRSMSALAVWAIDNVSVNHPCDLECAVCRALRDLHERGELDDIVRSYIATASAEHEWWEGDAETGRLRWEWVTDRWNSEA